MQREEVGARDHVVERVALDAELAEALGGDERVVSDDAHLQAERAPRDLLADAAEAEDSERLLRQLDSAPLRALPAPVDQRRVRLRDVARERDEQADRVLGSGHDVRLGCVRDDDPLAGRGVDVDVVDPHPGAADHLQARALRDQLGGQLGGRPDHDRVVEVDDLAEVGVAVLVDLEAAPQQLHARRGDLLTDKNPHRASVAER